MRYLFDSDVLISAKNFNYKPSFCPAFWDWIIAGHNANAFFSIDKVKKELLNGDRDDPLYAWSQDQSLSGFFLDSKPSISKWAELSQWANDPKRQYLPAAKAKFLNVASADAWLIAYAAMTGDFLIVTNEVSAPQSKRDIKLPDAALALGVKTVSLPSVLTQHAHGNFVFK